MDLPTDYRFALPARLRDALVSEQREKKAVLVPMIRGAGIRGAGCQHQPRYLALSLRGRLVVRCTAIGEPAVYTPALPVAGAGC